MKVRAGRGFTLEELKVWILEFFNLYRYKDESILLFFETGSIDFNSWGLAWFFIPTAGKVVAPRVVEKSVLSFMIEGIKRQYSAIDVLQSVEDYFKSSGASCKLNSSAFSVDIVVSSDQCYTISKNGITDVNSERSNSSLQVLEDNLSFRILVFQQIPGTLVIKGSLQKKESPLSRLFSVVFSSLEESLKSKFCR